MDIPIARVTPGGAEEWDALWPACPHATYFQSREWAGIWSAYTGGRVRPHPLQVTFADGRSAFLPLSVRLRHGGWSRRYLLCPGGTYGGWLSRDPLTPDHAAALARWLTRELGELEWRLHPFDPLLRGLSVPGADGDETHALDLSAGFAGVVRGRSKANKAARAGVTIGTAGDEGDWRAYFALYEESLRRWGDAASSRYRWELFDGIRRCPSPHVRLWLARLDGAVIAGALCFYAARHAVYWHGAAGQAHFELRPVNLLMQEAVRDACDRGLAWFDFNPSGGHEGVRQFKLSLGGQPLPAPVVRVAGHWPGNLRRVLRRLAGAPT